MLMREFRRTIFLKKNYYTFSFLRVTVSDTKKYFVSVSRKKEKSSFEIVQDPEGMWKIVPPVPDWIEQLKSELFKLIEESSDTRN